MNCSDSLSLIICTYKRPVQIASLLRALGDQTRPPDEILIVDGSPDAETERAVRNFQENKTGHHIEYYSVPPEHRGLTRQRNFGIERAKCNIVAFLDDDTTPEAGYFGEVRACFERHPEAVGVGGYITNEVQWWKANGKSQSPLSVFRLGEWERREDYRWRLRRALGLTSSLPPGWMPPFGHGRSTGFLPPDNRDYQVEFLLGGASAWRRDLFARHQFSLFFAGYGLYEDMDFCIRAAGDGPLFVSTRARLAHCHAESGRPNYFRYGEMVVRNGWYVWRRRWPNPKVRDRVRWWWVTILLALCRLADIRGASKFGGAKEALGRVYGATRLFWRNPITERDER